MGDPAIYCSAVLAIQHYIIKIMRHALVSGVHSKLGRDKSPIWLESKEDEEWRTVSLI